MEPVPEGVGVGNPFDKLRDLFELGMHENAIDEFARRYTTLHAELTFLLRTLHQLGWHQFEWARNVRATAQSQQASGHGDDAR